MEHRITIDGFAYRLRPVEREDIPFVYEIRRNPSVNKYLNKIPDNISSQYAWFDRYIESDNDYYFLVERISDSTKEGLISIYNVSDDLRSAEWGRWVINPGSLSAPESVSLIYRVAFELLGLNLLYCRTVSENLQVISFHSNCGLTTDDDSELIEMDNSICKIVRQSLSKENYPYTKEFLQSVTHRIANRFLS